MFRLEVDFPSAGHQACGRHHWAFEQIRQQEHQASTALRRQTLCVVKTRVNVRDIKRRFGTSAIGFLFIYGIRCFFDQHASSNRGARPASRIIEYSFESLVYRRVTESGNPSRATAHREKLGNSFRVQGFSAAAMDPQTAFGLA